MLGLKLVHLIETHSEILSQSLTEHIHTSGRTSDFHKIPAEELQRAARDVYRNLGDWLLRKTEKDIAGRFRAIGALRFSQGVRLHQFAWALMLTRDHLWHFLRQEAFADNIVELHAELELQQLLNQFFDRALFYGVEGYEEANRKVPPKTDLQRVRDLAVAIGLVSAHPVKSQSPEE